MDTLKIIKPVLSLKQLKAMVRAALRPRRDSMDFYQGLLRKHGGSFKLADPIPKREKPKTDTPPTLPLPSMDAADGYYRDGNGCLRRVVPKNRTGSPRQRRIARKLARA